MEVSDMSFTSKKQCADFLLTKRNQGLISDKSWALIQHKWKEECKSLQDFISLTESVYKALLISLRIVPANYIA